MRYLNKPMLTTQPRHKEYGAVIIEFALLLIPLLMIVAGIIEFGRTFWYYDALTKATRDGARFLSMSAPVFITINGTATPVIDGAKITEATDLVVNAARAANVPNSNNLNIEVECYPTPDCEAATPDYVTVRIDAYPISIGGWMPFFIPTGTTTPTTATTSPWSRTLSPYTTMRYMR